MHPLLLSVLLAYGPSAALWEVRSEVREERPGALLQVEPSAAVSTSLEEFALVLKYEPRFLFPEPGTDRRPLNLQRVAGDVGWRPVNGTLLGLRQSFRYGREDFSWITQLSENPTPSFGLVPLPRPLLLMESVTLASVRQRLSKRVQLELSGGWQVSGGADAEARATVPLARTGMGSISMLWTSSRDRVSLTGSVSHSMLSGLQGSVLGGVLDWTHTLRPRVDLLASIGLSRAWGTLQRALLPTGTLAFKVTPMLHERRLGGGASLSVLPSVDPLTGTLVGRIVGTATAALLLTRELVLSAGGGAARVTTGPAASTIEWQALANATWALGPRAALFGGMRAVSEPQRQWAAVIGFTASRRDVF